MDYTLISLIIIGVLLVTFFIRSLHLAYIFSEIFIQRENYLTVACELGIESNEAKRILKKLKITKN